MCRCRKFDEGPIRVPFMIFHRDNCGLIGCRVCCYFGQCNFKIVHWLRFGVGTFFVVPLRYWSVCSGSAPEVFAGATFRVSLNRRHKSTLSNLVLVKVVILANFVKIIKKNIGAVEHDTFPCSGSVPNPGIFNIEFIWCRARLDN